MEHSATKRNEYDKTIVATIADAVSSHVRFYRSVIIITTSVKKPNNYMLKSSQNKNPNVKFLGKKKNWKNAKQCEKEEAG